jgi:D-alanine-D-alanine ligase
LKQHIGILFGGPSGEHEVSIESARNIHGALDSEKYHGILIGLDKQGAWRLASPGQPLVTGAEGIGAGQHVNPLAMEVLPVRRANRIELLEAASGQTVEVIDLFFPIAHGSFGEDGCLQGFLRLLNVPFVGAGVLGSAVAMDKDVMKRLLQEAGLPGPRFQIVRAFERDTVSYEKVASELGQTLFIKPCNLGSSVGISKVRNQAEFDAAMALAFQFDQKVIIEENIVGREIECAMLGNGAPRASVPGEILVHADFYSYDAKYVDADGAGLDIPARLDPATTKRIQELAVRTFQVLECAGFARVDFFLKENGEVLVNEINTLPGFTRISMYPKLWEATGIGYTDLLTRLIELAQDAHKKEAALKRSYKD